MNPIVVAGLILIGLGALGVMTSAKKRESDGIVAKGTNILSSLVFPIILIALGLLLLWTYISGPS